MHTDLITVEIVWLHGRKVPGSRHLPSQQPQWLHMREKQWMWNLRRCDPRNSQPCIPPTRSTTVKTASIDPDCRRRWCLQARRQRYVHCIEPKKIIYNAFTPWPGSVGAALAAAACCWLRMHAWMTHPRAPCLTACFCAPVQGPTAASRANPHNHRDRDSQKYLCLRSWSLS